MCQENPPHLRPSLAECDATNSAVIALRQLRQTRVDEFRRLLREAHQWMRYYERCAKVCVRARLV
jgi:hypothetical protein